jgi:hypothetical protein
MNGTYEQHKPSSMGGGGTGAGSSRTPRSSTIDDRASNSQWNGPPQVSEPTKPAGTPPSQGGSKSR